MANDQLSEARVKALKPKPSAHKVPFGRGAYVSVSAKAYYWANRDAINARRRVKATAS